jgi:hypothetical protein
MARTRRQGAVNIAKAESRFILTVFREKQRKSQAFWGPEMVRRAPVKRCFGRRHDR